MRAGILVAAIIPLLGSVVMSFICVKRAKEKKARSAVNIEDFEQNSEKN